MPVIEYDEEPAAPAARDITNLEVYHSDLESLLKLILNHLNQNSVTIH